MQRRNAPKTDRQGRDGYDAYKCQTAVRQVGVLNGEVIWHGITSVAKCRHDRANKIGQRRWSGMTTKNRVHERATAQRWISRCNNWRRPGRVRAETIVLAIGLEGNPRKVGAP